MNAQGTLAGGDSLRAMLAKRLRAPKGKWKQNIRLHSKAEFDALYPGWAMPWRGFWFVLTKKSWQSGSRRGMVAFRVL